MDFDVEKTLERLQESILGLERVTPSAEQRCSDVEPQASSLGASSAEEELRAERASLARLQQELNAVTELERELRARDAVIAKLDADAKRQVSELRAERRRSAALSKRVHELDRICAAAEDAAADAESHRRSAATAAASQIAALERRVTQTEDQAENDRRDAQQRLAEAANATNRLAEELAVRERQLAAAAAADQAAASEREALDERVAETRKEVAALEERLRSADAESAAMARRHNEEKNECRRQHETLEDRLTKAATAAVNAEGTAAALQARLEEVENSVAVAAAAAASAAAAADKRAAARESELLKEIELREEALAGQRADNEQIRAAIEAAAVDLSSVTPSLSDLQSTESFALSALAAGGEVLQPLREPIRALFEALKKSDESASAAGAAAAAFDQKIKDLETSAEKHSAIIAEQAAMLDASAAEAARLKGELAAAQSDAAAARAAHVAAAAERENEQAQELHKLAEELAEAKHRLRRALGCAAEIVSVAGRLGVFSSPDNLDNDVNARAAAAVAALERAWQALRSDLEAAREARAAAQSASAAAQAAAEERCRQNAEEFALLQAALAERTSELEAEMAAKISAGLLGCDARVAEAENKALGADAEAVVARRAAAAAAAGEAAAVAALKLLARFVRPLHERLAELTDQKRFLGRRYRRSAAVESELFALAAAVSSRASSSNSSSDGSKNAPGRTLAFDAYAAASISSGRRCAGSPPSLRAVVVAVLAANRLCFLIRCPKTANSDREDRRYRLAPAGPALLPVSSVTERPRLRPAAELAAMPPPVALETLLRELYADGEVRGHAAGSRGVLGVLEGNSGAAGASNGLPKPALVALLGRGRQEHATRLKERGMVPAPPLQPDQLERPALNRVQAGRLAREEYERGLWRGEGPGQPASLHLLEVRRGLAALERRADAAEARAAAAAAAAAVAMTDALSGVAVGGAASAQGAAKGVGLSSKGKAGRATVEAVGGALRSDEAEELRLLLQEALQNETSCDDINVKAGGCDIGNVSGNRDDVSAVLLPAADADVSASSGGDGNSGCGNGGEWAQQRQDRQRLCVATFEANNHIESPDDSDSVLAPPRAPERASSRSGGGGGQPEASDAAALRRKVAELHTAIDTAKAESCAATQQRDLKAASAAASAQRVSFLEAEVAQLRAFAKRADREREEVLARERERERHDLSVAGSGSAMAAEAWARNGNGSGSSEKAFRGGYGLGTPKRPQTASPVQSPAAPVGFTTHANGSAGAAARSEARNMDLNACLAQLCVLLPEQMAAASATAASLSSRAAMSPASPSLRAPRERSPHHAPSQWQRRHAQHEPEAADAPVQVVAVAMPRNRRTRRGGGQQIARRKEGDAKSSESLSSSADETCWAAPSPRRGAAQDWED